MTPNTETRPPRPSTARIIVGALILLIGVAWMLEITDAVDEIPWAYLLPAAVIVIGVGLLLLDMVASETEEGVETEP